MPVLGLPSADLRRFPRRTLRATADLHRIHRAGREPWWFSSDGQGRFDLAPPDGTCYVAATPLGAFVEVFRDLTYVDLDDVTARRLTRLHPIRDLVLADCLSPRARAFGVTAVIHSTPDHAATQLWAAALHRAGFDGVRYACAHDPSGTEVAMALFGPAGAGEGGADAPAMVTDSVLVAVERRFGIHVLPTP